METNTGSQIPLPRLMGMCVAARLSVGVTVGVSSTCTCAGLVVLACAAPLPLPSAGCKQPPVPGPGRATVGTGHCNRSLPSTPSDVRQWF